MPEPVRLGLDELEALRLADYEGLYQAAAARAMEVSRQTFGRIIESARRKVCDAILHGKTLQIEGGPVRRKTERVTRMKIALPTAAGMLDSHFGHCQYFTVFTVEDKTIVSEERIDAPAGCGCKSDIVATLAALGVTVMIAGGIGDGAVRVLAANGIQTVRVAPGPVGELVAAFVRGELADSGIVCHDHSQNCAH